MKDISNKILTLRTAVAVSVVKASSNAVAMAVAGTTSKGHVWDIARAAGVLAAKKTFELIPYCHNISIDHVEINFEPTDSEIKVLATAKAIAKTGVEMEALTAASVAALTIYDMLKPIDANITIKETRLMEKHGGKSDFIKDAMPRCLAAVLVTSDSVSGGKKDDKSGRLIVERLKNYGADVKFYTIVPDDGEAIASTVRGWLKEGIQLIITTGGTGLGPRDVTADTIKAMIEREVPGIAETIRTQGQCHTPYSMLSRGVAGVVGRSLIITLPGSLSAVKESLNAIFPYVFHIYPMLEGKGH